MDFVKAAYAIALDEDFAAEEIEKLEAWRQAVTAGEADPGFGG